MNTWQWVLVSLATYIIAVTGILVMFIGATRKERAEQAAAERERYPFRIMR